MMKKGFKISLLILSSITFLTACNGEETVTKNVAAPTGESVIEENNIENNTAERNIEIEGIDLNDDWYRKNLWFRGTYNTKNIIHIKEDSDNKGEYWLCAAFSVICRFYPDSASEITAENLGQGIRYAYDDGSYRIVLDYFPETNQILLVMPLGSPHTGTKYDYSDLYEYDSELTKPKSSLIGNSPAESPDNEENAFPFSTGQQLECFETETGEDVIITIDIQNSTPYIIFPEAVWVELEVNGKGNSWEFINPYFTEERVYTTVSIQDNEITIATNKTFMYDGTYIQLPDIDTEGE